MAISASQRRRAVRQKFCSRSNVARFARSQGGERVILLEPLAEPVCDDLEGFLRFASACFRQKRKTLRNNLAGVFEKARIDALPRPAGAPSSFP